MTNLIPQATLLAWIYPQKRQALAELFRQHQAELFKAINISNLDPNYNPATSGALLRLLDPTTAMPLRDITESQQKTWREELESWVAPERITKFSNRGLQFYLDHALQASLGLEILLAREARLTDSGEMVYVPAHGSLNRGHQSLPERSLA
ncbi:MAG: hypothetical protein AAB558_04225 [Patescibacteria group bacterium]